MRGHTVASGVVHDRSAGINVIHVEINRSADDVFAAATNPDNTHLWIEGLAREWTSPTRWMGEGTSLVQTSKGSRRNSRDGEWMVTSWKTRTEGIRSFKLVNLDHISEWTVYNVISLGPQRCRLTYADGKDRREQLGSPMDPADLLRFKQLMENGTLSTKRRFGGRAAPHPRLALE